MLLGRRTIGTISIMGGIPSIPEPFVWSYSQMREYNSEYLVELNERIEYQKAGISFHAAARNDLVNRFLGDWLVQLDTDHQFEPDIIARLLFCADKYKLDVLTGIYTHKTAPYVPVVYKYEEQLKGFSPIVLLSKNCEIFEIGSAGAGCLFVRRKVFERIKNELKESPFDITHPYGEDHSFFLRLRKLGIKSYCNPHIECHHLSWKPTQISDLKKDGMLLQKRNDILGLK